MKKKYLIYILISVLLCAVIAVAVYALHTSAEEKMKQYEEGFAAAQVAVTVTTATGEYKEDEKFETYEWVYKLFTDQEPVKFYDLTAAGDDLRAEHNLLKETIPTELSLAEYVKDVRIMMSQEINNVSGYSYGSDDRYYACGITSIDCDPMLASEECEITWYDGYDESIFEDDGLYCLVPDTKLEEYDNGNGEAVVTFYYMSINYSIEDGKVVQEKTDHECSYTMKIVGTYTGGDRNSIYCPLSIVKKASGELEADPYYHYLSAKFVDNSRLDEFREKMSICFLEPSPENDRIPWGYHIQYRNDRTFQHKYYPFALDIDDEALIELSNVKDEVAMLEGIIKAGIIAIAVIIAGIPVVCLVISLTNKKKSKAE